MVYIIYMKLKVICLNVWYGGRLFDNIKAFIAQENADILALQEVYQAEHYSPQEPWHAVASLALDLGYEYYVFAPAFAREIENGQRVQFGNAILSHYPIQTGKAMFYDLPYNSQYVDIPPGDYQYVPRNLQHAEILIDAATLHVFNTQGIWGFNGEDTERRLHMGEVIALEVAGKQPALLMGDFNVQEGSGTIQKIEAQMHSVFKGEMTTSFNMKYKDNPGYAKAIVDMMFASPDIVIGRHYVSQADVSDHLALVGEFTIT